MDLQNNQQSKTEIEPLGPRKVGNATILYKTIMGILGGIGGTFIILIVVMLVSSLFPNVNMLEAQETTPILTYMVLVMAFLATLIGNLVPVVLFYLVDREKYPKLTTNLIQGFIFNLLIFIFSIPLYLIIQGADISTLVYIIGIHFLLSAFITSIVIEILSSSKYILVGLYGNTFAILAALVITLVLSLSMADAGKAFLLFLTMPLIWGCIGFFQGLTEMVYRWFYDVYGIDFLSEEAKYEYDGEENNQSE